MASAPEVTESASVMAVFSSVRDFSEPQSAARSAVALAKIARENPQSGTR